MKPEELKLIAESVHPDKTWTIMDMVAASWSEGEFCRYWEYFNPLTNKAQEMDLVRAYRELLTKRYKKVEDMEGRLDSEIESIHFYWHGTKSPEALCAAYLKLIKGEGEAS